MISRIGKGQTLSVLTDNEAQAGEIPTNGDGRVDDREIAISKDELENHEMKKHADLDMITTFKNRDTGHPHRIGIRSASL